jgi:hypothetical protein
LSQYGAVVRLISGVHGFPALPWLEVDMTSWLIPVLAATTLLACAHPTDIAAPDENGRVIGTLEDHNLKLQLQIPGTVQRGQDFTVAVTTYGGGCISKGDTEVDRNEPTPVITPYDIDISRPDTYCTLILKYIKHEAVLRFDTPGVSAVTIRGQRKPSREIFSVTRTLIVQ